MGDTMRYEHKTVKAVRGVERALTVKWENRGWELVARDQGTIQTVLTFRRPRVRVNRSVLGFVVLAFAVAAVITVGALTEDNDRRAPDASSSVGADTGPRIEDFLAARRRGVLAKYVQEHSDDPLEFEAEVKGVGAPALKQVGIIIVRPVVDGTRSEQELKLVFGGLAIPFPSGLEDGQRVRVRAYIDRYFDDDEVWLSPDGPDSFIHVM